jgi:glycosyltransferase involved in cell wall biosynthesis
MNKKNILPIIAHLSHFKRNGTWASFEPYVREIEYLASRFQEVHIFTDVVSKPPNFSLKSLPENCKVKKIYLVTGPGILKNITRIFQLPIVFFQILIIYFSYPFFHTRTSGFPTLFINLLNFVFNKPTIEKWATNFPPDKVFGCLWKIYAKLLLKSRSNTKVMVYNKVEHHNFVLSFPALFSKKELVNFKEKVDYDKWRENKNKFVCVARLHEHKNIIFLIHAVKYYVTHFDKKDFQILIVGDGHLFLEISDFIISNKLEKNIILLGKKPFEEVIEILGKSNFLIMPGINEGWAKVINEALSVRCLPIVVNEGNPKRVMNRMGDPGLLFNNNYESFSNVINSISTISSNKIQQMLDSGEAYNYKITLEKYLDLFIETLDEIK